MPKLRVIDGIKKEKPNYRKLYSNAFSNTLNNAVKVAEETKDFEFDDLSLDIRKKLVLYYVKKINATNLDILDYELLVGTFNTTSMINSIMGTLTPREFQTIFPIRKDYDGEKYEMKDYFYTKKYIEKIGIDKVIGKEATGFHMEYHNSEIARFAVQAMCTMSAIRRAEGDKSLGEEFSEELGVTTYTKTEDDKGKEILKNNDTGEVQEVMSFRDAVHNWIIELFDYECKGVLDDSMKGKLTSHAFNENASAVFGSFLTELYTENREKFIELAKPIHEEYCRMKSEDDAYWKREQLKSANLRVVK